MATLNNTVTFSAQVNQALKEFQRYADGVATVNSGLRNLKATAVSIDSQGGVGVGFASAVRDGKQLTGVVRDVGKGFELVNVKVKDLAKSQTDLAQSAKGYLLTLKDVTRIVEASAVKTIFGSVTNEIKESIGTALKYQIAISEIRTISQQNQLTFNQWGAEIKKVSDQLGLPIADVAEANYLAISNQVVKGAESFEFLARAGDLARVSQASLTQSVDAVSTVLNSYNLSISEAERISAIFFKSVELGRFRLSEVAGGIGRATFLGNSLGVTFEEINAALAVLTIQGVKGADATTLLTNVFQKLLRPTERMKSVLKSFGVETGQQAIAAKGFSGVLQELINLSKQGDVDIGELFNEIRGRKGFEGLANFEGQFTDTLDKLKGSLKDYRKAIEIRAESPADFLIKEANKLKNNLNQSVGQPVLQFGKEFVQSVQNTAPEFKTLEQGALSLSKTLFVAAAAGTALSLSVKGISAAGALNPFGLLVAGAVLYGTQVLKARDNTVALTSTLKEIADERKDQQRDSATGKTGGTAAFESLKNNAAATYQSIAASVARVSLGIDQNLGNITSKTGLINESLKLSFKSYFDQLSRAIDLTEQKITQTRQNILTSKAAIQDFRTAVDATIFQSQLEFATPQQQSQLIRQKIQDLRAEAQKLSVSTNDPEKDAQNAQLADQKLREAVGLVAQDLRIQVDLQVKAAEAAGFRGAIEVNSLKNNQAIKNILAEQEQIQLSIGKQQQLNLDRLEQERKTQKERAIQLQALSKEFADFSITDKDGIKKEFTDPVSGKFKAEQALAQFNNLAQRFQAFIGSDANAQINFLNLVGAKKVQLEQEIEQRITKIKIDEARKRLDAQKTAGERELKDLNDKAGQASNKAFGQGGALDKLEQSADAIKQIRGEDVTRRDVLNAQIRDKKIERAFGANVVGPGENEKQVDKILTAQERLDRGLKLFNEAVTRAKQNRDDVGGFGAVRERDIQDLDASVKIIQNLLKDLVVAKEGNVADPLGASLKSKDGDVTIRDLIGRLQSKVDELKAARTDVLTAEGSKNAAAVAVKQLENDPILKQLKDRFPAIAEDVEKQAPRIQTQFNNINEAIRGTITTVEELQKAIDKLDVGKIQPLRPQQDSFENDIDSGAQFFARGGIVGQHPGGPRGTDTVAAWLTPGERVLTAQQNRVYERLITSLKPFASRPRYFSQGGVVTTNVGDIHVSVSGAKGAQPLEQIARGIRRGIKRGSIKL